MWKFEFSKDKTLLALGDMVEEVQDVKLHAGLTLAVALEAGSQEQAEAISKGRSYAAIIKGSNRVD